MQERTANYSHGWDVRPKYTAEYLGTLHNVASDKASTW
jgi:hypothetical protein